MCYSLNGYKGNLTGFVDMKGDREKIPQSIIFFYPRNPMKQFVIIFSTLYLYMTNVVYKNIFRKLSSREIQAYLGVWGLW